MILLLLTTTSILDSFTHKLHSELATKYLGSFNYFLRPEASPTIDSIFINHLKYAHNILIRAQMLDNKLVHMPMIVSQHLFADGSPFSDPTIY